MKNKRIIPVLTIIEKKLVKTIRFSKPKYIGDPINAIKIFNEKEVDELIVLDINATKNNTEPDYEMIRDMAGESFMPIGYGGGITRFEHAQKVVDCGVEKIILNSATLTNKKLVSELAEYYGSQSVVVVIDYKSDWLGKQSPYVVSGTRRIKQDLVDWAKELEDLGAGELILQSISRDGTFEGYDIETIRKIADIIKIPLVAAGGARGYNDFRDAIEKGGANAAAAGSHFIFKNNNRDSILINYNKN